jgi:glutamyl-tRNA synthetase
MDIVRTRFAPSPTGSLHVGNARTALFNYLLARKMGGVFVLRMEDTDRVRSTQASAQSILADLRWLGLDWDEGPDKGGAHGPYEQSARLGLYQAQALALEKAGRAFWCFDTSEQMESWNAGQNARKRQGLPREPHPDQALDAAGRQARLAQGLKPALRFICPDSTRTSTAGHPAAVVWSDRFHGLIATPLSEIGDFNLLKSDGMPSYNFACVVDDHGMAITHVLRGEDGMSNTPRQVLLYEALGWQPPEFGHLGFVLGPDGGKLSKSHGSTSVSEFREQGHLPQAMVNYLGLLGLGGAGRGEGSEARSLEQLIDGFSLGDVVATSGIFDFGKLGFLGGHWMRSLPLAEITRQALPHLRARGLALDPSRAGLMLDLARQNAHTLAGLADEVASLAKGPDLGQEPASSLLAQTGAQPSLRALLQSLPAAPWDGLEALKASLKAAQQGSGFKGKDFFMPLRAALTGAEHGPELPRVLQALGREEGTARLSRALAAIIKES